MRTANSTFRELVPGAKRRDRWLSGLSAKHRGRYQFSRLPPEIRTVLPHCVIGHNSKVVFIKNSKAACTTVAHLMYRHDNGSDYSGNIHHAKDIESPFAWPTLMDRLKHGYLFSVVRNPEARAVSGFFDFFVTARNREAAKHHPYAGKFGILKHDALTNRFDAFLDYVGAALDADPLETDRHFRPQHLNLGHDHIELSYVARVEHLENDLREIGVQTGMNLLDEQDPISRRRNVSGSDAFQITAQQRAKIEAMFAKDYEIYGY